MAVDYNKLSEVSKEIRRDIIRSVHAAGSGHPGGSLSAADILAVLYFHKMNIDPKDPKKVDRDRFVLSKGHAAPVLYSALAERGFIDKDLLLTLRKTGSPLQGHPDMKKVPGVEMSTVETSIEGIAGGSMTDYGVLFYAGASFTMGLVGVFAETGYGIIFVEDETPTTITHIPIRGGIKVSI